MGIAGIGKVPMLLMLEVSKLIGVCVPDHAGRCNS